MKAKLSYSETQDYIDLILELPTERARNEVYRDLALSKLTEGQFHDAIEHHAPAMNLSSEQWLKIFQTYSSPVFAHDSSCLDYFLKIT